MIFLFFLLLTLPMWTTLRSWQRCQKYLPLQYIYIYIYCYLFPNVVNTDTIIFLLQIALQNSLGRQGESVLFHCTVFLTKCSFFFFFFLENPVCFQLKLSIGEALLLAGCQTRQLVVLLTLPLSYATSLKLLYLASLFNTVS